MGAPFSRAREVNHTKCEAHVNSHSPAGDMGPYSPVRPNMHVELNLCEELESREEGGIASEKEEDGGGRVQTVC